jgi:hypothetical protein
MLSNVLIGKRERLAKIDGEQRKFLYPAICTNSVNVGQARRCVIAEDRIPLTCDESFLLHDKLNHSPLVNDVLVTFTIIKRHEVRVANGFHVATSHRLVSLA